VINPSRAPDGGSTVIDFAYLAGTVLFFALMLGYVRVCERLGRVSAAESSSSDEARP
jgi:hypothetical protein